MGSRRHPDRDIDADIDEPPSKSRAQRTRPQAGEEIQYAGFEGDRDQTGALGALPTQAGGPPPEGQGD